MAQEKVRFPGRQRRVAGAYRLPSLALAMTLPLASCSGEDTPGGSPSSEQKLANATERTPGTKIQIKIGGKTLASTLRDNPSAKDFISLLPLTLHLEDYASTEKIGDLPRKLIQKGAPAGADPSVGDIAYYAPWGNLAIYCRDSPYANGLIILGEIDGDLDVLKAAGAGKVTIELTRSPDH